MTTARRISLDRLDALIAKANADVEKATTRLSELKLKRRAILGGLGKGGAVRPLSDADLRVLTRHDRECEERVYGAIKRTAVATGTNERRVHRLIEKRKTLT